jgi:hypothetical protein
MKKSARAQLFLFAILLSIAVILFAREDLRQQVFASANRGFAGALKIAFFFILIGAFNSASILLPQGIINRLLSQNWSEAFSPAWLAPSLLQVLAFGAMLRLMKVSVGLYTVTLLLLMGAYLLLYWERLFACPSWPRRILWVFSGLMLFALQNVVSLIVIAYGIGVAVRILS